VPFAAKGLTDEQLAEAFAWEIGAQALPDGRRHAAGEEGGQARRRRRDARASMLDDQLWRLEFGKRKGSTRS
jgi:hypothetical protein